MFWFANLDLEILTTRALLVTDISTDIGTFRGNELSLRLYPEFTFTNFVNAENGNIRAQLMYASSNAVIRSSECTSIDFRIGAWRSVNTESGSAVAYRKIADFMLQQCNSAIIYGCCEFNIPSGLKEGDILGISHGERSSLQHSLNTNLTLRELSGEENNNEFVPSAGGFNLGYPLLTIEPCKLSHSWGGGDIRNMQSNCI